MKFLRSLLAALAAALLTLAPAVAPAQTISAPGFNPPITASCGTVTVSTPCLDLSQIWNNSGTTFTGLKYNFTPTAAADGSKFFDIQQGGSSIFNIQYFGAQAGGALVFRRDGNGPVITTDTATLGLFAGGTTGRIYLSTSSTTPTNLVGPVGIGPYSAAVVYVVNDASNILAQRNSTSAQTFRVYNTFTDASNYERGVMDWSTTTNVLTIGAQKAGTGTARKVTIFAPDPANLTLNYAATENVTFAAADYSMTLANGFVKAPAFAANIGTQTGTSYTVAGGAGVVDSTVIFTNAGTVTVTLPTSSTPTGRTLHFKTTGGGAVNSASSNVVPLAGGSAGTAILATTAGKWATLQFDGTNWVIIAAN